MSKAICKTCGAEVPNHRPSLFDGLGIGNAGHRVFPKDSASDSNTDRRSRAKRLPSEPQAPEAPESKEYKELDHLIDDLRAVMLGRKSWEVNPVNTDDPQVLGVDQFLKQHKAALTKLRIQDRLSELEMFKKVPLEKMSKEVAAHISRRYKLLEQSLKEQS